MRINIYIFWRIYRIDHKLRLIIYFTSNDNKILCKIGLSIRFKSLPKEINSGPFKKLIR